MRRKAFTLIEAVVGILILLIMAASMTLSPKLARHTAKREADRIVAQIYRLIETANRTQISFEILFDGNEQSESVQVEWESSQSSQTYNKGGYSELKISDGFTVKSTRNTGNQTQHKLIYSLKNRTFNPPGMTLHVKGNDDEYYIIIYATGGRIRTSDSKNLDKEEQQDEQ